MDKIGTNGKVASLLVSLGRNKQKFHEDRNGKGPW